MPIQNLVGDTYGELTVLSFAEKRAGSGAYWNCRCSCGKLVTIKGGSMRNGGSKSCGCLKSRLLIARLTTHGLSSRRGETGQHPMYGIWLSMRQRCSDPSNQNYHNYGGRGINVCDRWQSFINFKEDMFSTWKQGLSIERRDNNKGYEPDNCHWATIMEQAHNKRSNVKLTYKGKTLTLNEWSRLTKIPSTTLSYRNKIGWDVEKTLTTPPVYARKMVPIYGEINPV